MIDTKRIAAFFTGALLLFSAVLPGSICPAAAARHGKGEDHATASIEALSSAAEDIYDAVKDGDWRNAEKLLGALRSSETNLPSSMKKNSAYMRQLEKATSTLSHAIRGTDGNAAMSSANEITFVAIEMARPFKSRVPQEVALLDYYGRELELGSRSIDASRLSTAADGIRKAWKKLRPAIESRGGNAEAIKFDGLVARMNSAKLPGDYSTLAVSILDEVDNLEKVFE